MSARRVKLGRGFIFAALVAYGVWVVFPMLWVAYSSLKADAAIFRDAFSLPGLSELHPENYTHAWREAGFGAYFLNSVVITAAAVTLILVLGAPAAYALARFRLPGGRAAYGLFLAGLMIPAQLSIIPLFFELRRPAQHPARPDPGVHGERPALRGFYPHRFFPRAPALVA